MLGDCASSCYWRGNTLVRLAFGLIWCLLYLDNLNRTNSNVVLINQKNVKDFGIE